MSKIIKLIQKVHENVHGLPLKAKKQYSEPKIYCGGGKPEDWNKLSKEEQASKLEKEWYVRWSFRNPDTGYLERQDNIKGGANYFKTFSERFEVLDTLRKNLSRLLKEGFNPFDHQSADVNDIPDVEKAFTFALDLKKSMMKESSFTRYKSRINKFKVYLLDNGYSNRFITSVDKKIVVQYLNEVFKNTSARSRNNTRSDIASLFQVLEDNEMIKDNFVQKINILKAKPKRNKAFTIDEVDAILNHLKSIDNYHYCFYAHVYYGLFREVEICRITVKDVDKANRIVDTDTKTGDYLKQIPNVLYQEFYSKIDLDKYESGMYLFTRFGEPDYWDANDDSRREYWGKYFKRHIKDNPAFDLDDDHTVYSLRHSAIGRLFLEKIKELQENKVPNFVDKALQFIQGITLHKNTNTVREYLREIGYYKIEDWSKFLK